MSLPASPPDLCSPRLVGEEEPMRDTATHHSGKYSQRKSRKPIEAKPDIVCRPDSYLPIVLRCVSKAMTENYFRDCTMYILKCMAIEIDFDQPIEVA